MCPTDLQCITIADLPISENPLVAKSATHVTLMWSPPFLWPGQRIQCYNISVNTNKDKGASSHHMFNTSYANSTISFTMRRNNWTSSTLTCTEIKFSILPVTDSDTELIKPLTITDWMWSLPLGMGCIA